MQNNSHCPLLYANVLVLTILSDKYRHYLNVVDENNKINQVQNFRNHKMAMTDNVHMAIRDLMNCTFNTTDEKQFCEKLPQLKTLQKKNNGNCVNVTEHVEWLDEFCEANALKDFVEHFNLFEFIVELTSTADKGKRKYDLIVLDVTNDSVGLSWRPSLILQQNYDDIHNMETFITHSLLLPIDYHHTLEKMLWKCGNLCWTIITIFFGILLIIIVSVSLLTGIAVR